MDIKNVEFKARVNNPDLFENKLMTLHPKFHGVDHQIDTYFDVPKGRLKLREGNIEHALIQYNREDKQGAKLSEVILYNHVADPALKKILTLQFGVKVVVDKVRKIYFIENVKFHFDQVKGLGGFIEVEVIDQTGLPSVEALQATCNNYLEFFDIKDEQLMKASYSDLLLTTSAEYVRNPHL